LLELIGGAACLVMPSVWYETFGRTIIEAFAKGTPVIASRLGAMGELVDHGRTGLHFAPGNSHDLRDKVQQLLSDPAALSRMRLAVREEYESKYTAEMNYRLLMDIYARAMNVPAHDDAETSAIEREGVATIGACEVGAL
jgi:glycosyltransferase involved in cell wall biosynthesis